ncbi:Uncharacterized protein FVE85_0778 [Porphyridium purpureum]|uniref:Thiol-disulfide oxidoreductase DCC n=1 Tax=Porphyridium purpureum TaxID=35688 RepID=A0A5J4YZI1_PORPP|nr:Uncharacterized protein FVE85_0778 [Porphyridium purpureum]|eukprot:POR5068..scf208_2
MKLREGMMAFVTGSAAVRRQLNGVASHTAVSAYGAARRDFKGVPRREHRLVLNMTGWKPVRALARPLTVRRMASLAETDTKRPAVAERNDSEWKVRLLYDSECVLCMREVNFLQRRDVNNHILFVDIASDSYSPEDNAGLSYELAMRRIHGILRDGTVLEGVPVFRKVYEEIGLGYVYAITKIPLFGFLAAKLYDVWADYRLRFTGRKDLADLVREREQRLKDASCEEECIVPAEK